MNETVSIELCALASHDMDNTQNILPPPPPPHHPLRVGVFIMYDLSPMMVQMTERQRSFAHFLTGLCAIVGGVFTVAGMVDGFLYHSTRALKKKIDLGKAS